MKVIIVGGVAGSASCAAWLRRLDEEAEILMVERGTYIVWTSSAPPSSCSAVRGGSEVPGGVSKLAVK